ncbi:MAG TPA: hypothetical protein VN131_06770 [Mobilitalea sp.]|nr:hypothetical protein [Mobilitalea sp.]
MHSLNFDEGYKEFSINGDENRVIRFNPADYGLLERYKEARNTIMKSIDKLQSDIELKNDGSAKDETDEAADQLASVRQLIFEQVNYIFNADVSKTVFGNQSPISTVKGKFLFEGFIEAAGAIITDAVNKEQAASQKRIDKYVKQVR